MGIGDAAEVVESALIILLNSAAVGIHATKFPGRRNIAVADRVLQRFPRGFNIASLPREDRRQQVTTPANERPLGRDSANRRSDIGRASGAIKGVGGGQPEAEPEE